MKFLTVLLVIFPTTVFADTIDFTTPLLNQDGKPKIECLRVNSEDKTKCTDEINMTLGWLLRFALDIPDERGAQPSAAEIYKRGKLSEKIKSNDSAELSVDEAKLLKDQIIKMNYQTSIKFQALRLIDPKGIEDGK